MAVTDACPAPTIDAGIRIHGFVLQRVTQIPEIRVTAYEAEHEASGAKVLHLHCGDRENLFAIGFRTPPRDATGLPHILEHSVLAGSERYPLKDVFNELLRGSLQTFLNAFTYPDKTVYPAASQIKADFYNLARVYLDLVFRPRLRRETFLQEGHHLAFVDPEKPDGGLTVTGIVYNEMKGAYASPEALLAKTVQEGLYPDTVYALDAGGDPECIPSLEYDRFRDFHRTFYSPANARIFLYGDLPTEEHLAFLDGILSGFSRVSIDSTIPLQPRWPSPRQTRTAYPIDRADTPERKAMVHVAWMLAENTDTEEALRLAVAAGVLIGNAAGPLRKALVDSGLGEDLSPLSGIEKDLRQMAFGAGLRGADPRHAGAIEDLILRTLRTVASSGFDPDLIEGTFHQVEFHGREIVRGSMPYGIVLMDRAFHTWLYDGDPLTGLNFPRAIRRLREEWNRQPDLFTDAVRRWLLDNPHRLLVVLEPSPTLAAERERAFRERMDRLAAASSAEERRRIREDEEALRVFQEAPDPPEAAGSLPVLRVADLPRTIDTTPMKTGAEGKARLLTHEIFANGIAYMDLAFDVSHVPEERQPLLPLFAKLLLQTGAGGKTYEDMAKRITLHAGSLHGHLCTGQTRDGDACRQKLIVHVRALHRNIPEAVRILSDLLTAGDFSEEERIRNLLAEKKNGLRAAVAPSGHVFARRAAGAAVSLSARRDEQWHGITQLRFAFAAADAFLREKEDFRKDLMALRDLVIREERLTINLTGDAEGIALFAAELPALREKLPRGSDFGDAGTADVAPAERGIVIPAEVSYVAQAFRAPAFSDPLAAPLTVLSRYLANAFLYQRIRVQGGAYGAMCQYDPSQGLFAFLSYRDPRIVETLAHYREASVLLRSATLEQADVDKAIIGAIGGLDRPLDPYSRGYAAMMRDMSGTADADRQAFRDAILGMTAKRVREGAGVWIEDAYGSAVTAVLAAETALRAANARLGERLRIEPLL